MTAHQGIPGQTYYKKKHFEKLRWCHARDLFASQIPVTTGGFELRISCMQTLLWSLEFVIRINLEHDTIALSKLAQR